MDKKQRKQIVGKECKFIAGKNLERNLYQIASETVEPTGILSALVYVKWMMSL